MYLQKGFIMRMSWNNDGNNANITYLTNNYTLLLSCINKIEDLKALNWMINIYYFKI